VILDTVPNLPIVPSVPKTLQNVVGRQLLCDFWECEADLASLESVLGVLRESVKRANVTLLEIFVHEFSPQGVTAVAVIAESHIFIHTWPEKGYVAVDAFTCGANVMPERAIQVVSEAFCPKHTEVVQVHRRSSYHDC